MLLVECIVRLLTRHPEKEYSLPANVTPPNLQSIILHLPHLEDFPRNLDIKVYIALDNNSPRYTNC